MYSRAGQSSCCYSAPLRKRSIAIGLSVCKSLCGCMCVSGTAGSIFTKFFMQIPCGHGSALLWRRCDMLCTFGFMDDVTFGRNGLYDDAWQANLLPLVALQHRDGVYECLIVEEAMKRYCLYT